MFVTLEGSILYLNGTPALQAVKAGDIPVLVQIEKAANNLPFQKQALTYLESSQVWIDEHGKRVLFNLTEHGQHELVRLLNNEALAVTEGDLESTISALVTEGGEPLLLDNDNVIEIPPTPSVN